MWAGWMMMADDCHKRNLLAKQLLCSKKPLRDGAWSGLIHWWGKMSQIKRQFMLEDAIPCSYPTSGAQVAFSMQEPSPAVTDTNGPSGKCGVSHQSPRGILQQSQAPLWSCHPSAWLWPARTGWPCSPAVAGWSSHHWGITQNTAMFAAQNQNIQSLTLVSTEQSQKQEKWCNFRKWGFSTAGSDLIMKMFENERCNSWDNTELCPSKLASPQCHI